MYINNHMILDCVHRSNKNMTDLYVVLIPQIIMNLKEE